MKYIVYEAITGEIIRSGTCPDEDIQLQPLKDGEAVKEPADEAEYLSAQNGSLTHVVTP